MVGGAKVKPSVDPTSFRRHFHRRKHLGVTQLQRGLDRPFAPVLIGHFRLGGDMLGPVVQRVNQIGIFLFNNPASYFQGPGQLAIIGIKLFVQRVFIMDEAEKLMPRYLRFVRGLVDSNDLPLNVSREILQNNKIIETIRSASVKRVLGILEKMAEKEPEKYQSFWSEFGNCLKEAPGEDFANKEQVAKLYRFDSTHADAKGELTSLDDYLARAKVGQDKIYYITGDSYAAAKNSPHLEVFRDKGIEVLLMHDRVDEWMMSYLHEYEGKSFVSIAKGDLDLSAIEGIEQDSEEERSEKEKKAAEVAPTIERIKGVLAESTSDVKASTRLTSSPACVVMGEHDMALHMQQLLKQAGHELPSSKPVLEVNPTHPILELMDKEQDDDRFKDWAHLLLDQALLADGGQLEDSAGFVKRMNDMFIALKA